MPAPDAEGDLPVAQAGALPGPGRANVRDLRLDALRGVAVFGILLVNIWAFSFGFQSLHYGVLPQSTSTAALLADRAAVFFTALLAEQKFYPVFSFLFGASFALYAHAMYRRHGDWALARRLFRGRLRWLLCCGLLHGALLWFGDILSLYGSAGFLIAWLAGARLRIVLRLLVVLLLAWAALLAKGVADAVPLSNPAAIEALAGLMERQYDAALLVYTTGSASEIALLRLHDFAALLLASLSILPQVLSLFLLGILAVRLGWLTHPQRHVTLWRRVRFAGLFIGVPSSLAWAWAAVLEAGEPAALPRFAYVLHALMPLAGSILAAAYVASFMLARDGRSRAFTWLAAAGRMSLTSYLLQSLLCSFLLQGWGLGLGATLSPWQLMLVFATIVGLQMLMARLWLRIWPQGPVEMVYRWQTAAPRLR